MYSIVSFSTNPCNSKHLQEGDAEHVFDSKDNGKVQRLVIPSLAKDSCLHWLILMVVQCTMHIPFEQSVAQPGHTLQRTQKDYA